MDYAWLFTLLMMAPTQSALFIVNTSTFNFAAWRNMVYLCTTRLLKKVPLCPTIVLSSSAFVWKKKVCEGHDPQRELTPTPDLRRLTRRVLQVAELLPWPVKDRLFQIQTTPYGAGNYGDQVFWRGET